MNPVVQAVRRAWNLPDKRAVLSSVANLMICGEADVHPSFDRNLARRSSWTLGTAGGDASNQSKGAKEGARSSEKERCDRLAGYKRGGTLKGG